jgi:DNA-binding CsgD family transcriptional regulator/tetratricopeptide (TPR) repeat protein
MHLFERDGLLAALEESLATADRGNGRFVLVAGEAGAGKSTLVRTFLRAHRDDVTVRLGACDPLTTPRPLGPLQDVVVEGSGLADALDAGLAPSRTFPLLLDELRAAAAPTVLVVEDAHWADESTLDLLRYLARRIVDVRTLVVVTYREDDLGIDHPVRLMVGDLASTAGVDKLLVPPLTRQAVEQIAVSGGVDGDSLYRATGGNPFYISEVLAAGPCAVPDRVFDAVLARAARLPDDARSVLETASVISTRVGIELLAAAAGEVAAGLDACLVSGMLVMEDDAVRFRHELARRAVESSLSPMRRRQIHRDLLPLLTQTAADAATLAHHAVAAGDTQAVILYGLQAADRAAALGAHREAAAHLAEVLRHSGEGAPADRGVLLDRLSYECYLTDQIDEAIAAREQALKTWQEIGDGRRVGDALRWLSRLYWFVARGEEAAEAGCAAVEVLQKQPEGHELAMAYSNLAQLAMLRTDGTNALHWGAKALDVARVLDDIEVQVHALNSLGTIHQIVGDPVGIEELERSLSLALENDMQEHVARAYTNLMTTSLMTRRLDAASRYADLGIAYATEHDLDAFRWYMTAWRATGALSTNDWKGAADDAAAVLRLHKVSLVTRMIALQVLGRITARRGDDESIDLLDEALAIAVTTGEPQRLAPVVIAHAEAAWLRNESLCDEVLATTAVALRSHHAWEQSELAVWLMRLGHPVQMSAPHEVPFALSLAGEHDKAYAAWMERGCHYEAALAAIDGDDARRIRASAEWLVTQGATAVLPRASARLRELGSTGLRGPRPKTARNPSGLTQREVEVLALMAEGLADRQIAQRLVLSPRTIHHHVSAVLRKLDVTSRHEAGDEARRLGIPL